MKPLSESRLFAWLCIIFLAGVLSMILSVAYAGGTDIEQETNVHTGDTTIGGNDSLGFAHSLGDVDINQCMASTAWGTILVSKQKVILNKWCAGEVYDAKGLYKMGAIMRCSISDIRVHFPDHDACLAANEVNVPVPTRAPPTYDEDEHDGHTDDINALQARLQALEEQRLKDAEAAQRAARRAQAAAKEVEQAEADRKEYAQQVYEELKEWQ